MEMVRSFAGVGGIGQGICGSEWESLKFLLELSVYLWVRVGVARVFA